MKKKDLNIKVDYLTRVEGHGNIVINTKDGRLEECRLEIIEAPRFFEAMLRGRPVFEAQHLTSRVCGICASAHSIASSRAVEDAIGHKISEQAKLLRELLLYFEVLDSHLLHIYFLVAPDVFGVGSVIPLLDTHKEVVMRALKMKKVYSDLCEIMTGRHTHPITVCPRGWTKVPGKKELVKMRALLTGQADDIEATVAVFKGIKLPSFERETEYVALSLPDKYTFYEGDLISSDVKGRMSPREYKEIVHEYHVAHSTAKHSKNKRASYMVGALARVNLHFDKLNTEAKQAAKTIGFSVPCHNPYLNTSAQLVELVHSYHEAARILDGFIENGIDTEDIVSSWLTDSEWAGFKCAPETGVGIVEAPRGTLIHEYTSDARGVIQSANLCIPTNQNLANIELDMRKLVPEIMDKSKEEITLLAEMLVRAYDPCISCSTHMLKVEFR